MTENTTETYTKSSLLSVKDLHKTFRIGDHKLHVLRGVDVDIHTGEWVAIVGASGSGKSTLLHLLGALDRPDQGNIYFNQSEKEDGQPIFGYATRRTDQYRNRHVGFVFQAYHLLPELTALENVLSSAMIRHSLTSWLGQRKILRERARQLLVDMGLSHRINHVPTRLSGGERQRVAIARALMNEPALLLADEPTGNLDAETAEQILEILKTLHQKGQTIVMVTHDQKIADEADRSIQLAKGKIQS